MGIKQGKTGNNKQNFWEGFKFQNNI
uniref:Uncharacterized protein n=1 Tax=Anguilla anguilla TaxID=7936 RepID=A0A0E9PZT3_ANGAN